MEKNVALNYIRRRKRRKRAAFVSLFSSIAITVFIIIAFCLIYVDRFTVTTSGSDLFLTVDETCEVITTKLEAPPLLKAIDTQYTDIPDDIEEGLGSKNTNQYFAYSFYLGCKSERPTVDYSIDMTLNNCSNQLEDAIRVMIIRNGEKNVYAKAYDDGAPKEIKDGDTHESEPVVIGYTKPFYDNKHIILRPYSIVSGEYDRYTMVMWIDGWESDNSMKGGTVQTNVKFSTEINF